MRFEFDSSVYVLLLSTGGSFEPKPLIATVTFLVGELCKHIQTSQKFAAIQDLDSDAYFNSTDRNILRFENLAFSDKCFEWRVSESGN